MSDQPVQTVSTQQARPEQPARRSYRLINLVALALALGWLLLIGLTLSPEVTDLQPYWSGATDMLRSGDPYASVPEPGASVPGADGTPDVGLSGAYIYPPLFAYAFQPLGRVDLWRGQQIWFVLNGLFLAGWIALCLRMSGSVLARRYWGIVVLGVLIAPPTRLCLQLGQIGILFALMLVGGFALRWRHAWVAGVLLALTSLVKLYPALLGLYYLLRRPRAVAWWAGLSGGIIVALSLAIYGVTPYLTYIRKVVLAGNPLYAAEFNISLFGFWERLLVKSLYAVPLTDAPLLARAAIGLTSILVLSICVWASRGPAENPAALAQFCVWLCGMLLLSPINGFYNLVLLLLPLLVMLRHLEEHPDRRVRTWLILGTALACWPPAWTDWQPVLYSSLHVGWGILLLTPSIYGLLIYLWLLVRLARRAL